MGKNRKVHKNGRSHTKRKEGGAIKCFYDFPAEYTEMRIEIFDYIRSTKPHMMLGQLLYNRCKDRIWKLQEKDFNEFFISALMGENFNGIYSAHSAFFKAGRFPKQFGKNMENQIKQTK